MSCPLIEKCPSRSRWCDFRENFSYECVPFLIIAFERLKSEHPDVLYLCDMRACEKCHPDRLCQFTKDIRHARNFERIEGAFVESK